MSVVHLYSHLTMLAETPQNVLSCQVCSFVRQSEAAVVRPVNITELTNGSARLQYTYLSAWFQIQSECTYLRRTRAHLKQGTRPSHKLTNIKDVKRYLQVTDMSCIILF